MKIDVTKIEGYEAMTAEQKVAALEGFEYEDNKRLLSQRNSEVANGKKEIENLRQQLKDKMSAEELAKAESEAKTLAMETELKDLRRKTAMSENTAKFAMMGYSAENAGKMAAAVLDGDMETFFAVQKSHNDALAASIEAKLLKGTTTPEGKSGNAEVDLDKMTDAEYFDYIRRK